MKKIVIALLLCTALCAAVFAQNGNDFEIIQNRSGGITITRYTGTTTNVVIPSTIEGIRVTEIGGYAFDSKNIISVTVPDSVTSIGKYAFKDCDNLSSVTIGNSVTKIGEEAFEGCKLTSVTIGNSVTQFGKDAFPNNFADFYIGQGKKAGTYMWSGRLWKIATAAEIEQARKVLKVEMIRIPGGTFQMGKELAGTEDVTPVHTVTLSAFSMGKYPVTQELYYSVTGNNPSKFISDPASGEAQGKRPVESITWYDAVEFCNKLSAIEGLQAVYTITSRSPSAGYPIYEAKVTADFSKNGYRLPTEAQWEYAAKGGNPNSAGWKEYMYSGSNKVSDVAWYGDNSGNRTHEVGKKAPNGLGLYDMSGNVLEWCWDFYGNYTDWAQTDPMGTSSGTNRVFRGGCWRYSAELLRSTYRFNYTPSGQSPSLGFRLVRP
ncbi:SUMF1/EgtB/PvdO family nonheme iron enzyme [Treponema sp. R80B11-R83G3]